MTKAESLATAPDESVIEVIEQVTAVANACESYAYQLMDVGDADQLLEVRVWHDRLLYALTPTDKRGAPVGSSNVHQLGDYVQPFEAEPSPEPIKPTRWWRRK